MEPSWECAERALGHIPHSAVGGVATAKYMPQRATLDLDFAVVALDAERVGAALRAAGFARLGALSIGGSSWRAPDGGRLDVLYLEDCWAEAAVAAAMAAPDPQLGMPVLGLPFLVLMKMKAGRPQDVADVSRMLGFASAPDLEAVRSAVARYGVAEDMEDLEQMIALGRLEHER